MTLKEKILSGWWYKIDTGNDAPPEPGTRNTTLYTGKGGVHMYIDSCHSKGLTDEQIAPSIFLSTKDGYIPMSVLKVINKSDAS